MSREGRRYVFPPLERRGLIAGLSGGQVAILATGLVGAVAVFSRVPGVSGLLAAATTTTVMAGAAFLPLRGQPIDRWIPVVVRYVLARPRRRGRGRNRGFAAGTPVAGRHCRSGPDSPSAPPSALRGARVIEVSLGPGRLGGAVLDVAQGTLVGALEVRGQAFSLLDPADKERRLASWASVLSALSREGGPVRRIQWLERTAGGDAEALCRHVRVRGAANAPPEAATSYDELVREAGPLTQEHECLVVLAVAAPGANRDRRRRRSHELDEVVTVLGRELRLLEGQLRAAEVDVVGVCGVRRLAAALRVAFDPLARADLARRASGDAVLAGADPSSCWPVSCEHGWSSYRSDRTWHATFWVAEWPRIEVGPDFLCPLLLGGAAQRTVALTMAPLSPSRGAREAESARTAAAADEELRRRAGFLATARRRREAQGLAQREAELADGHSPYRFCGYVTVSAAEPAELEEACAEVMQAAHRCHLDLRRLYGLQDLAFTWTLPLARGVR